jgi:hypothetical protein
MIIALTVLGLSLFAFLMYRAHQQSKIETPTNNWGGGGDVGDDVGGVDAVQELPQHKVDDNPKQTHTPTAEV